MLCNPETNVHVRILAVKLGKICHQHVFRPRVAKYHVELGMFKENHFCLLDVSAFDAKVEQKAAIALSCKLDPFPTFC